MSLQEQHGLRLCRSVTVTYNTSTKTFFKSQHYFQQIYFKTHQNIDFEVGSISTFFIIAPHPLILQANRSINVAIWHGIKQGGEPLPFPICLCFLEHLAARGVQLAFLCHIMLLLTRERGQWDADIHKGLSWVAGESGNSELSSSTRAFCPRLR